MSCYIRPRVPGASVFFTVNLAARGSDLLVQEIALLRRAVRQTQAERPFRIDACVVMPDHMHAVWTLPPGDCDFSVRWGAIKARFTMGVRRAGFSPPTRLPVVRTGRYAGVNPGLRHDKGEVGIWQRRFWEHHIRGPEAFADCVRYCHMNPVKHGFVEKPEEWLYSSVHRETRMGRWAAA